MSKAKQSFVLGLDTETTGLDYSKGDRIIEFAGLAYDSETRVRLGGLVQRVDPERSISAGAQRVHGIAYTDLVGKPKFRELAPKIRKLLLAAEVIVIHNAPFDLSFVLGELQLAGQLGAGEDALICNKVVDTCDSARWATPLGKAPTLGELCFALGQEYDTTLAHAAQYDVERLVACYFEGVRRGFFASPAQPVLLKESA